MPETPKSGKLHIRREGAVAIEVADRTPSASLLVELDAERGADILDGYQCDAFEVRLRCHNPQTFLDESLWTL